MPALYITIRQFRWRLAWALAAHLELVAAALRGLALHDHLLDERHHDDHERPHARHTDAIRRLLQSLHVG